MELSGSNIFSKAFLIFRETKTAKKLLIFQEMELFFISGSKFQSAKNKNKHSEKTSSPKLKKLIIFQEKACKAPS